MVHEMVMAEQILRVALEEAERNHVREITTIRLQLGEWEGIQPEVMREAFGVAAEGTIAGKASLEIELVPPRLECQDCGHEKSVSSPGHGESVAGECEECGGRYRVVRGRGWSLLSMRAEK